MVYFLIPVYNEAANLPVLADNLKSVLPSQDKFYVFSDDGSTDASVELLQQLFQDLPHHVISDGNNYGPGHAFDVGFEWILEHSTHNEDIIISLEADNTSDIALVPKMATIAGLNFDLVLASVYAQGGGFDKTSFFRKFLSFWANMLFRSFFNIKVLTLSSFYRTYKVSLLRQIKAKYGSLIKEKGFICMLEILIKAVKVGAKVIEIPMVLHSAKRKGASKMKIFKTARTYIRFLLSTRL